MDSDVHRSTSYRSSYASLVGSETSSLARDGHKFGGDVYLTGNAVAHFGDAISSRNDLASSQASIRADEERQRKTDLLKVKNVLHFDGLENRKAKLESASPSSVQWIWSTGFSEWLQDDKAFFWITGKPGSGKSTLIKYLSDANETKLWLSRNNSVRCVILDFFFDFAAGAGISNTKKGLLRSLLFQLISKCPEVADIVQERHGHALDGNWRELEDQLMTLFSDATRMTAARCCIFVDGLDEISTSASAIGAARDLVRTLRNIQQRSNAKICVSGRPQETVSRLLASFPGFHIQDHNAATIRNYIDNACQELTPEEIESSHALWSFIENEANGVILWARFVVDELVERLLIGATSKELQAILRAYPDQLEGVYERVLEDLLDEQKLHAAVAFYAIEHGLTRFTAGREFSSYEFFVTWTIMIESLDQAIEFDSGFDLRAFRIRIEALLGGLLEFSSTDTVRFVHTTLESFVRRSPTFSKIVDQFIVPMYKDGMAGQVFISIMAQALNEVVVDIDQIDFSSIAEDIDSSYVKQDMISHIHVINNSSHFLHRIRYLLLTIERLGLVLTDTKSQAHSVWAVVRSSLFELHPLLCRDRACRCEVEYRMTIESSKTPYLFWKERWCLRFLANHDLYYAYEHGIQEILLHRPNRTQDILEVTIDVVRKAQLQLANAKTRSDVTTDTLVFGLKGHSLIELILADQKLEAEDLTIAQIIDFDASSRFLPRLKELAGLKDNFVEWNSAWFPYQSANILCCWAWCSDSCYDRHTQSSRLQSLLDSGFDVNAKAYPGGTVMHALFDYREPLPVPNHTRIHHITWPFSRTKFDLLSQAGFAFSGPNASNLLEHVRIFRAGLRERNPKWMKHSKEDQAKLDDFDLFIEGILEPLLLPPTPSDRSSTPRMSQALQRTNSTRGPPARANTIEGAVEAISSSLPRGSRILRNLQRRESPGSPQSRSSMYDGAIQVSVNVPVNRKDSPRSSVQSRLSGYTMGSQSARESIHPMRDASEANYGPFLLTT